MGLQLGVRVLQALWLVGSAQPVELQRPVPNRPALVARSSSLPESGVCLPVGSLERPDAGNSLFRPLLGNLETFGDLSLHSKSLPECRAFPSAILQPTQFQNSNWIFVVCFNAEPTSF